MKNKYIAPRMWVNQIDCLTQFLAGSPRSGSGLSHVGAEESDNHEESGIGASSGSSGLTQCSKGFDAWSSWDE